MLPVKSIKEKKPFINTVPGEVFQPFGFSDFNLKGFYNSLNNEEDKKRTLLIIHLLFNLSYELYTIYNSCDWDQSAIHQTVGASIEMLKKVPALSRCKKAFEKIENSLSQLEDNMGTYYKNYMSTKNPSIIFELYITDITKN